MYLSSGASVKKYWWNISIWLFASTSSVSSIVVRFTSMGTVPSSTYTFCCASVTMQRAVQILDTEMMMQPTRKAEQMMPTSLILFSKFLITIIYTFYCFNRRCGVSPHTHLLSHHCRHGSRSRHFGLLCHALTEVSR